MVAPVYNTEKMREIHEDIVQTLVVVAIEHADAMLNAKATLPSGREVWFAVHDVQVRALALRGTEHQERL